MAGDAARALDIGPPVPSFKPAYLIHGDDHGRIAERRARLRAMARERERSRAASSCSRATPAPPKPSPAP